MDEGEIPVVSSSIATVRYMEDERILQVRFRSARVYHYLGVPRTEYDALMRSASHGKYLHAHIAPTFEAVEAEPIGSRPIRTERVRIQNFRSIRDMTVEIGDLTVLIGANGTGKTTILDALALFGSEHASASPDDFAPRSNKIKITLSMRVDDPSVPGKFRHNGVVEIQKSFSQGKNPGKPAIMAAAMCNRDFDGVRAAKGVTERKEEARRVQEIYPGFPSYTTRERWEAEFDDYERKLSRNPDYAHRYYKKFLDVEKGEIDLSRMLEVVMVPAIRDIAADGADGSGSHLSKLMDLAIRSAQKNDQNLRMIADALDDAYSRYMRSVAGTIKDINMRLASSSERYMSGAEFTVDQEYPSQAPANPRASVRMKDGEFMVPMDKAGSGAQRVYLLSLLDTIAALLTEARGREPKRSRPSPIRLIAIDEPELYQHPQRQVRILRSLIDIVKNDPGVRIVCSTHSPYFVRLKRVYSLRLLQKSGRDRIRSVTPERLARLILPKKKSRHAGAWAELSKWLDMSATHWVTEGFFARLVVITEGQGDRSMLLATASAMGIDLARHEITMVPATGLDNVERFARLFGEFGIPVYLVWDRDGRWDKARGRAHRKDLGLADIASGGTFGGSLEKTTVVGSFACVKDNLTVALARDLRRCEGVLGDSAEYGGLKKAVEQDRLSALQEGQKCHKCGAARARPAGGKVAHRAQKDFLNNRMNVSGMLGTVRMEGGPGRLESFTTAKIVRQIERAAGSAGANRGRPAGARDPGDDRADSMAPNNAAQRADSIRPSNDDRADSRSPGSVVYETSEANREIQLDENDEG